MKKIIHDALILTAFTLVLGLCLGLVHDITQPRIDAANAAAQMAAFQAVFADASSFTAVDYDVDAANAEVAALGYSDTINDIETALDADGNVLGYVISVTAKDGSQGSISFSVGIQNDGTVNGYSITDIAETPGLGMKATEASFSGQFAGKNVEKFSVTKMAATSDSEIEAITGSTITSKAMANGVNASLEYFRNHLVGGAQ